MPFSRPTPTDLRDRIRAEIDIELPGSDARLRQSVESVVTRVLTMSSHELFGYLSFIALQILPDKAEEEFLERHASLWGIIRKPATVATGTVNFTGQNGTVIPAGTILQRTDAFEYTLDADVTIAGGIGSSTVTALLTGAAGNAEEGTKLNPTSPISGMNNDVLVDADGLSGGNDTEEDDALRARIIERIQFPPHGGAYFDYIEWAKEVPGVTRVWVYPEQLGLGTVEVIFVMDNKVGTIIPAVGEVQDVQDHIDAVRPVTADVTVIAPTAVAVDFTIHIGPNTVAVQNAIKAELADFFKRESEPGGTLFLSRINEAISVAAAEFDHVLITPNANVVRAFGEISTLGIVTFAGI